MTESRFLRAIDAGCWIPEQTAPTHSRWRRPERPRRGQFVPGRAPALIDELIDRVHRDWPETSFIMALPSGERVFMPKHTGGPSCTAIHSGYFRHFVLPFCQADPTSSGGRCRMKPVAIDAQPALTPFYEIDLRSGMLLIGAGTAPEQRPAR